MDQLGFFVLSLRYSVKTKITVFVLVIFTISIWILAYYAQYNLKKNIIHLTSAQQNSAALITAKELSDGIFEQIQNLEIVAKEIAPDLVKRKIPEIQAQLEKHSVFKKHFNGGIIVIDKNGIAIVDSVKDAARVGVDYSDREYFKQVISEKKVAVSQPLIGKKLKVGIIPIAVPIFDAKENIIGVLVGAVNLALPNFLDKITKHNYGHSGNFYLVSRKHRQVITSSDKSRIMQYLPKEGQLPVIDGFIRGEEGTFTYLNPQGVEVLGTAKNLTSVDWFLAVATPISEVMAPISEARVQLMVMSLVITLCAAFIIWYLLSLQLAPLLKATKVISYAITDKKIPIPIPIPIPVPVPMQNQVPEYVQDEISVLLLKFNQLLKTLEERNSELRESQKDLFEAQAMAHVGSWTLDLLTNKVTWTEELFRMQGLDPKSTPPDYTEHSKLFTAESWNLLSTELAKTKETGIPYEVELEMRKPDESFGWMLARGEAVRNEKNEIVKLKGIALDITERKLSERLTGEKVKIEAAAAAKGQFLSNMSHEIRTPLNAIVGMVDVLNETKLDPEQKKYIEIFKRAGENLINIVNDILDFSKIDSGALALSQTEFDVKNIIDDIMNMFRQRVQDKHLSVTYSIDPNIKESFIGDALRIKQVLMNLVGNAIKFTNEGAVFISVRLNEDRSKKGNLLFQIVDSGIGISEIQQQKLFQTFVQGDVSTTKRFGGTGLGLVISKNLAELMGGEMWLSSKEGAGTTVAFTIDCKTVGMNVTDAFPDEKQVSPVVNTQAGTVDKKYKILLVDDSEDNRLLIHAFLKKTKHQIVDAENGKIALEMAKNDNFDIILMDMQMPVMNGYDSTKEIRAWEKEKNLPHSHIIAITAYAMKEDLEKSLQSGCDQHLSKPIHKKDLLQVLGSI